MFEKQKITLEHVQNMELPAIIIYAVPFMLSLVVLEWWLSYREKKELYETKDFFASAGIGVGNLISSAITKLALFAIILYFYNLSPLYIPPVWWSYIPCLIVLDFCRYWAHRVGHEQRIWWATHIPHHSSEKYNFSVSFRLSWVQQVKVIFFIPIALMGFHPVVFFICNQISVLYQFWLHTELIRKMPAWFEYVMVTPSHHRVHHGRNGKYLDKNYGSTFIIWDRIFGTFQVEEERPDYGITEPVNSYNPAYLVFHEFIEWAKDLRRTRSFRDAWLVTFGKPAAVKEWRDQLDMNISEKASNI